MRLARSAQRAARRDGLSVNRNLLVPFCALRAARCALVPPTTDNRQPTTDTPTAEGKR